MQSVAFEDFSGGLTDYPLSAGKNKCKVLDNVLLRQYEGGGKPYTRPGSGVLEPQLPSGQVRISTLFLLKNILFAQAGPRLYYFYYYDTGTSAWVEILGPTGNPAFPGADDASRFTHSNWNSHTLITHTPYAFPKKVYLDDNDIPKIVEAGLPAPLVGSATPVGTGRLMKWVFKVEYVTSGDVEFLDVSEPTPAIVIGTTYPVVATFTPIDNTTLRNYDTANIKFQVYLTEAAGTTYYFAGEVANSAGTISIPAITDANLKLNPVLYTEGGVVGNSSPLPSECVHICDEVGYYGGGQGGSGELLEYRVMCSVPSDIDSVPSTFFTDLDDKVVGISSVKSTVVALGRYNAYRLQNNQDELGQGSLTYEKISDTASCVSGGSVVQTLFGVFWAGFDGIYYTDGYEVRKLNIEFDKTYKTWTHTDGEIDYVKAAKIQGAYNRAKNTIAWTVQNTALGDCDKLYILDLTYGIRQNSAFMTWSGANSNYACNSIVYGNGNLYRGDANGYVLVHQDNVFTDPVVDTGTAPSNWQTATIFYNITTADYDFGTSVTRKYIPLVSVVCEATTNLSLQITANTDSGRKYGLLKPIRTKSTIVWGTSGIYWGTPGIYWNARGGVVHHKRRIPAGSLRSTYMSLIFTNAKVAIVSSDTLGTVDVDGTANTATLTTGGVNFSNSLVGYYISFAADGYVAEYAIASVSTNVATLSDLSNTLPTTTDTAWVIRGYPRGEVLNLLNATINYEMFGPTQATYTTSQSGEVGS